MCISWMPRFGVALLVLVGLALKAEHQDPLPVPLGIAAPTSGSQFGLGIPITFQGSGSWGVLPYWHFGDGTPRTHAGTHTYGTPGNYSVRLQFPAYQQGSSQNGSHYEEVNFYVNITILAPPVISSFYANPASINRGASSTLIWTISGAGVSFNLSPGTDAVTGGSKGISPTISTTYTLTAANASGSVSASTAVIVNQPPVIGTVSIEDFQAQRMVSFGLPKVASDPEKDAITYKATDLPTGLTFNEGNCTISGIISTPGPCSFTYWATDAKGAASSKNVNLTVIDLVPSQTDFTTIIKYDYDPLAPSRLKTLTYPSGRAVGYTYDDLDRVKTVTYNGQSVVSEVTYDEWGNQTKRQFNSWASDEWEYGDASHSRVTKWSIATTGEGAVPEVRTYGYDAADRLIKAGEWTNLVYDSNSRLKQADAPSLSFNNTLDYDAYNNNISSTGSHQNKFTITQSMADHNSLPRSERLDGQGGLIDADYDNFGEITYIAAGNTSSAHLTMTWDGLGRMTSTKYGSAGAVESSLYAASGLRVRRIDSLNAGHNRFYAYTGGGNLLSVFGYNAAVRPTPWHSHDLVYIGGEAIAQIDGVGVHAYHNDHLGTPRVITNPAGVVEGTRGYGPYGEIIAWSGSFSPTIGFTGHQMEPTGLIYMRGRFYSPAWHRFMNSDQGVDPGGLNQFSYVVGNPLMHTDPTGMIDPDAGHAERDQKGYDKAVARDKELAACVKPTDNLNNWQKFTLKIQRFKNWTQGLGLVSDDEVPAALAALKISNPMRYGMLTTNDPILRGIMDGGFMGGLKIVGESPFGDLFGSGRPVKATELKQFAENQGWKPSQTESGPLKFSDESGIVRMTIKQGSARTPGSADPHVELRNPAGQRIGPDGNPVPQRSPGNHTPIDYDF